MATFSKKVMGKEVGDAKVYAKPHDMKGKALAADADFPSRVTRDPNTLTAREVTKRDGAMRVSLGDPGADDVKTTGIKMRGTGAATKGVMSRGPMG
jgi:hypothetical protein